MIKLNLIEKDGEKEIYINPQFIVGMRDFGYHYTNIALYSCSNCLKVRESAIEILDLIAKDK